jgi:NAD(P)-dependent dehydrogenase (short-subunit alcohol dehydrogenase family)
MTEETVIGSDRLRGKVAVVTGASRGAGRGIALALGEAGATVYVIGRTTRDGPKPGDGAEGTIEDTAEEVTARGGVGIPVRADCTVEQEVAAVFERVKLEQGRLDILANAVWGAADSFSTMDEWMASMSRPFWQQPSRLWQDMMVAGPFAYLLASSHAAPLMADTGKGLIVGVTDGVIDGMAEAEYGGQLVWDLSHRCINRMLKGMSVDAKPNNIAVVTLMPGFMRTERVMRNMPTEELKKLFGFEKSESTEYIGRAVSALGADANVMQKTGELLFVADLAQEYGFTDVDGRFIPKFNPFG